MSLEEKIVANRQKRNLLQMHEQLKESGLHNSVVKPIYYPESGTLLDLVLKNMNGGVWQKHFYTLPSSDCENNIYEHLAKLSKQEETMICFFPDYSPQINDVISDLPILEISANKVEAWYKFAKGSGLHFFLCSSMDLRKGIVLDVYEADPVVHRTAGAVCDLYFWEA